MSKLLDESMSLREQIAKAPLEERIFVDLIPISQENLDALRKLYESGEGGWVVKIDQYRTPHGYRFSLS